MTDQAQAEEQSQRIRMPFLFGGNASEYFGIWIVNLLLSIITIGIYTAWAKVRRLRYFYGNTWLDGHNFEYHAKGSQILIGRIIVVGVLLVAYVLQNIDPVIYTFLFIPYLIALPWLINKTIQFNARMTSYRNIRLGFNGTYLRALWVFTILPFGVFIIVTLLGFLLIDWKEVTFQPGNFSFTPEDEDGQLFMVLIGTGAVVQLALIPYISKVSKEYIGNRLHFGGAKFETDMPLTMLYKNFAIIALAVLVPIFLMGAFVYNSIFSGFSVEFIGSIAIFVGILALLLMVIGPQAYAAGVRNIAFNHTVLDGKHQFVSTLSRRRYVWILVTNLLLIVITIGLMRPWAAVRTWNYLAENTAVDMQGGVDNFIETQRNKGNVVASEYMDIEGIDFGL